MSSQILVCNTSFVYEHDGVEGVVNKGTTVREGHPILKGREHNFVPFVVDMEYTKPAPAPKVSVKPKGGAS